MEQAQTSGNATSKVKVDYALLLRRMEKRIAEGRDLESVARVISRPELWRGLSPPEALRCARLAQAAGNMAAAQAILEWITTTHADFVDAWRERVALLEILGKGAAGQSPFSTHDGDATQNGREKEVLDAPWADGAGESEIFAHAELSGCERKALTESESAPRVVAPAAEDVCEQPSTKELGRVASAEEDFTQVEGPFWAWRRREAAIARYMELFRGREDCFARQWVDRAKGSAGYVPVRRALEAADIQEHLQGRKTYGIYLLQQDSRVWLGVIDADLSVALRSPEALRQKRDLVRREQRYLVTRLVETARERHMPILVEFSGGKGFHFWFCLEEALPAAVVRQGLQQLASRLQPDLSCFQLEVFPKQDRLEGKGLGNLVKLPLGIHRLTGRPSYFLNIKDRSLDAQLALLSRVRRIPSSVWPGLGGGGGATVVAHPRREKWASEYPELALLEERCVALGQILVECRQQRALSLRAEKILFGTLGFLPRAKVLLHEVMRSLPEYNPHWVDYQLSRLRGTPLGCRKIHRLLGLEVSWCTFGSDIRYAHPLCHWPQWQDPVGVVKAERVENLQEALDMLREALRLVQRFLPRGDGSAQG
ncbi:MAG: CRISPR-associated primase-polymerase type A1 [Desulfosoma sp.]|uniref:CRISPR-associated primase-polymerase type A1 n=1 Tax=Desulfosoma sp. TaxID=2603217 RepID=UPI00404A06C1